MTRLVIVENENRTAFIDEVEAFLAAHECWTSSIKFQRNLYYKGIGSSAGATPGAPPLTTEPLAELFMAFILFETGEGKGGSNEEKASSSTPY